MINTKSNRQREGGKKKTLLLGKAVWICSGCGCWNMDKRACVCVLLYACAAYCVLFEIRPSKTTANIQMFEGEKEISLVCVYDWSGGGWIRKTRFLARFAISIGSIQPGKSELQSDKQNGLKKDKTSTWSSKNNGRFLCLP